MSEYLIEGGLHALFYGDLLHINDLAIPITTTELDIAMLGALTRNGWAYG
jgi:hypothetical protein